MTERDSRGSPSPGPQKVTARDRALLVGWSAGFVVLIVVLALAIGSLFLRHQAVFAVRLSASPSTSCWEILIQVDGRIVSPPGSSPEWSQCGTSPAGLVELGACRSGVFVRGETESFGPLTELSVDFLRNSEVSETVTWNASSSRIHTHLFSCDG